MSAYRYLKGNKAEYGPQNVICVDTETVRICPSGKPGEYSLIFKLGSFTHLRKRGNCYSKSNVTCFYNREEFWSHLERIAQPRKTLWVFAHNIGFDSITLGFWQLLDCGRFSRRILRDRSKGSQTGQRQSEYRSGLLVTSDPPTIVECWTHRKGMIRLVDTLNYFSAPLSEVGKWVGLDKLPQPDPWSPNSEWEAYCARDTEILTEAVLKYVRWVAEHQLGVFAMTLPSQAMHGFRHSIGAKSIVIHDNKAAQLLESEAYRGGEVYVGRIGPIYTGPGTSQLSLGEVRGSVDPPPTRGIHHLDANSLFPAVMADNLYPRNLVEYVDHGSGSRALVGRVGPDCIAECLVCSDTYGVFTRRAGRSGRFTGLFVAVLAGPELVAAKEAGIVLAVRRYARYELADLFSSWVNRWWLARWQAALAGCTFESLLCKRIMNSLYGKFVQKAHEWEDDPTVCPPDRWGVWVNIDHINKTISHYRSIAGTAQRRVTKGYHQNAFVAISAFVTSYARERMRSLRDTAGMGNVYYQGIDSLYTSDDGLERLRNNGQVDTGKLGLLRHEETADSAEFFGWGLYRFGNKYVRTSISRGAIECHPGEFEQENFVRLETYLAEAPADGVQIKTVKRTIAASSPVGLVGKDGWVHPLPARWGDNPAETVDSRGFYDGSLGLQSDPVTKAALD